MHNKTRKLAILSLCMALVLSCVIAFVPQASKAIAQETAVAQIGDTQYDSFAEALAAANATTGNVTVKVLKKVTLNTSLEGSYDSLTFIGEGEDAEIYLDVQGYITATGKNLRFENLKLSKSAGGFIGNAGFMNVAFGVYQVAKIDYVKCTFLNGAYASSGVVTFDTCTFNVSHEKYGLWAYGDADITVLASTFDSGRAIKMYAEGAAKVTNLTVKDSDFTAANQSKPAIVLTYGESVTLSGNQYPSTGVFELDLDGAPNGTAVSSTDPITCVNDNGDCGVLVDGKIYQTVADAAAVATETSMITLLHNSEETITIDKGFVDKNGFEAAGVTATAQPVAKIGSAHYADIVTALKALQANDTLTLLNDVTYTGKWDNRYQGGKIAVPVTIDGNDKTLKIVGEINDGGNQHAVFRFEAPATVKNLTMDLSETTNPNNRVRAISSKNTLVVDKCEFVGSNNCTNTRGIIFGEGAGSLKSNVTITNSTFTNWARGINDNENAQDTALVLVITGNTFNNANVNVSAYESITFNNNNVVDGDTIILNSYANIDNLAVEYKSNTVPADLVLDIKAEASNITTDAAVVYGSKLYATTDAFLADVVVDGTLTLANDVKLNATLTLPENVTVVSNGHVINGSVLAGGTTTFADHAKIASFSVAYTGLTINIPVGGCLEMTGSGRMVIGHNTTFNITGSIVDAKNTDVSTVQPSLIANGASFTGNSLEFNATNAYIKFPTSYCSSSSSASGEFNFNIENSIWEVTTNKLAFEAQSVNATVNFNFKNGVINTAQHLVFGTKGVSVIDNSNVNVGTSRQLENRGTLIIKNGSVVHATNAVSSNAKMPGTLIVDNSTYKSTASNSEFSGSDLGIGTLIMQNGANVTLSKISKTNVYKYSQDVTFTYNTIGDQVTITELSYFAFDLAVDKTVVKAEEDVTVTISLDKDAYAVEHTFTYDKDLFTCAADVDGDGSIYANKFEYKTSEALATYVLTAKNEITTVVPETTFAVTGNVVETKELALTGVESIVTADSETIKLSLNYEAEIYADYVSGYSLVLVDGIDAGYAYAGVNMIFVTEYDAFAILVEGAVTLDMVEANLTKASSACKVITKSYDVNCEFVKDGKVDLKDATAVYACSKVDFDVASYMALYLRADVNNDFKVNLVDINAITANYNN